MKRIFKKVWRKATAFTKRFEKSKHLWSVQRLERNVKAVYEQHQKRPLDLSNPRLFTEKLQWYKLYYRFPQMEQIVDKYLFKGYIQEKLGEGYTIPLYGAWTSLDDLERDWDSLPNELCLKSTLQSDGNFIKLIRNRREIPFASIKEELSEWLKVKNTLINSYCRAYYDATPRILAEKFEAHLKDGLCEYKFFCFSGKPYVVYVSSDHFKGGQNSNSYPITFYDLDWNKLDVRYGCHENHAFPRPERLEEMKRLAATLSEPFPFVRVDFFDLKDKLYIAELTFYPGGGLTPYYPIEFNAELGAQFVLPPKQSESCCE